MNNRSKGRKGELEARQEWTERLNRFAAAKNAKQRQAAIEPELKINPGGAIRDLLLAWGYSASSRGRKAKGEEAEPRVPARQKLEAMLGELYGTKPAPVASLYKKLAGDASTSVKDACRIVAALISSWPEPLRKHSGAKDFAEDFIRELLSDLTGGRSRDWTADDMESRVFSLIPESRIRADEFIEDAAQKEGALIVASAREILLGPSPIETMRLFTIFTRHFVNPKHRGLLIFVFDAALFEAGDDAYRLLSNFNLLASAVVAFALFDHTSEYSQPIRKHQVDWSRWRAFSSRCCVVLKRPTVILPETGEFLRREKLDDFISSWQPKQEFARLEELRGFIRFDTDHVLPLKYPSGLSEDHSLDELDLYWDVLVRPANNSLSELSVKYFTPPIKGPSLVSPSSNGHRGRGRPPVKSQPIEEEEMYAVQRASPGPRYDDAQRAIYLAARGRLNLDQGERHSENLNAAAALRITGYEVLPISVMVSLFPRSLHFAAAQNPYDKPPL